MLKFCVTQWEKNKENLRKVLSTDTSLNSCEYEYLVELVVKYILNGEGGGYFVEHHKYSAEEITKIDDGHYQGTLLFLVPRQIYQPAEYEYLITYVDYGSCSGCDTLLNIQGYSDKPLDEEQINDMMILCKDIVCNFKKPFSGGSDEELYEEMKYDTEENNVSVETYHEIRSIVDVHFDHLDLDSLDVSTVVGRGKTKEEAFVDYKEKLRMIVTKLTKAYNIISESYNLDDIPEIPKNITDMSAIINIVDMNESGHIKI